MEKKSRDRINNYNVLQNLGAGARCYVLKLLLYEHPKLGHGFFQQCIMIHSVQITH